MIDIQKDREKITIDEVAKMCNVSKTTISRYLNGKYEYMSNDTKNLIQDVIKKLDYRPNNIARSLKSNKSGLIGAVIADIGNPFSSILVKGIENVCEKNGYLVIIANTDNNPVKEKEYIKSLIDNRVDGLIVNTTGANNEFLLEYGSQGLPIVLADRCIDKQQFDTVMSNNYEMTFNTIKYLVEEGFEKIALFTESISNNSSRYLREKAFMDASRQYLGSDAKDLVYVIEAENRQMINEEILKFESEYKDKHKAIFAINGVTLLSVLKSIDELKLEIPKDIGVCGYDDWGWAALIPPGITAIAQPSYEVGVESAKCLVSRITSKRKAKPKIIELESKLIVRGSTKLIR